MAISLKTTSGKILASVALKLVVYEVREDQCVIVAIQHAARKPGYWKTRLS